MSHSSVEAIYRPTGPGHRCRAVRVDLARIPDPEAWLTNRLGPLASFDIRPGDDAAQGRPDADFFDALTTRLTASMRAVLAVRGSALDALAVRLETAKPTTLRRPDHPTPQGETEA